MLAGARGLRRRCRGVRLGCQLVVVLIRNRPGLSAQGGLWDYASVARRVGKTDERANIVSNIRLGAGVRGRGPADRLGCSGGVGRGMTGVGLNDTNGEQLGASLKALSTSRT